ncbi:MAG TPA: integrase, partial [Chloroflexota bacterium]|nr:integrase [Chloroflexota bacterium]
MVRWLRPAANSVVLGAAADLVRSKPELIAENALLRRQLIVLTRSAKRPRTTRADRALLVLLASRIRTWRQALVIVQPATLLRWHRTGFKLFWRWRSAPRSRQPRVSPDTVALIERMARENRLWGAERIRGELLKLGIAVGKRTIQRHMRRARPPRPTGQTWATFLRTHGREIWACDFLQLTDLFFRQVFAFFVVELGSRRVVHVGVTRSPTDAWVAQQLREATPEGVGPRFLVHDHDARYGPAFARLAAASGIELIRTPVRAPRANAVCERFLGSVRRECVDHTLILGER